MRGAYSGCWGWLVNDDSDVSAHYVVKEDGSEISQLVKEDQRAWHIAAKYDKSLNGGQESQLHGTSSNNFTVGIEHAGYAKQANWNANLIEQSAKLVCDITKRQGIPRDKYHVVAHGHCSRTTASTPAPIGRGPPISTRSRPPAADSPRTRRRSSPTRTSRRPTRRTRRPKIRRRTRRR
ncbi:peptidoglycan recognition family protein [Nannocystis pusilla]|uniref:N-acetylmuramoyl-L-alanine amidase n=1 Tax=Nannocystis pusilla TaxID=889268 RepID=A0A9X3F158_9BACT|nr:peptidoglycan recognition family protein [Nannocystis pusilla]